MPSKLFSYRDIKRIIWKMTSPEIGEEGLTEIKELDALAECIILLMSRFVIEVLSAAFANNSAGILLMRRIAREIIRFMWDLREQLKDELFSFFIHLFPGGKKDG